MRAATDLRKPCAGGAPPMADLLATVLAPPRREQRAAAIAERRRKAGELRARIVTELRADPDLLRGVQTRDAMERFGCSYDLAYRSIKRAKAARDRATTPPTEVTR